MGYASEQQIEEHNRRMETDECYAEYISDLETRALQDADEEYQRQEKERRQLQFEINKQINWFPHRRLDYTGYEEIDVLASMFRRLPDDIPF